MLKSSQLKDCQIIKDLQAQIDALQGNSGGTDESEVKAIALQCVQDNQRTDAEINDLVVHPPVIHPEQEICTGDFVDVSGRTGWTHPWTATYTANSGTIIEDWVQISTAEVSPDCDTDITVNGTLGNDYFQLRNTYGRAWYDVRLLVDGADVTTYTFQNYHYEDDIGNSNLDDDLAPLGSFHFARASVPAGSTITVESARRHNFVVGNGQASGRVISGLRSHFNVHYSPTQIVTGRV